MTELSGRIYTVLQPRADLPESPRVATSQRTVLPSTEMVVKRAAGGEELTIASIRTLAKAYIGPRLAEVSLDIAALVRDLGVSRTRLYAAFADCGGVRAAIRDARLERVRALLVDPASRQRTIEDVARLCGFADYPSFARAFHRRFGLWPSDCRG